MSDVTDIKPSNTLQTADTFASIGDTAVTTAIDATATDDFHDNFIGNIDEENGTSHRAAAATTAAPASAPRAKNRIGWVIAGMAALLLIIALGVSLSKDGDGTEDSSTAAATVNASPEGVANSPFDAPKEEEAPAAIEDYTFDNGGEPTALFSSDDTADNGVTDINESTTHLIDNHFTPEETVGDAALLNLEESVVVASTTSAPVTSSPTVSVEPTKSPTTSPSARGPSLAPSTSPTKEPTNAPTTSPSTSPTLKPTFNFANWSYAAFGIEPTKSPTRPPTPSPTKNPTKRPTQNPTKQPTKQPTNQPTKNPTKLPTKQPTKLPTKQPTKTPTKQPTNPPTTPPPTPYEPFFFGEEFDTYDDLGIEVARGLSVRVIARTGERVPYANGDRSNRAYHSMSDAAGIISMNPDDPLNSGYVYTVNSEEGDGDGGVFGIYFNKDGNVEEYRDLLTGTTDNCGGGLTPWHTWVSCEEYEDGQCWQVDPVSGDAEETELGGRGGRYESVAVDNTNQNNPIFFTTEDDEAGPLRRFVARGNGWDALHSDGDHSWLRILDDRNFEWTTDEDAASDSAARYYRNSEGISYHEGKLYFMAKKDLKMLILDLEDGTYETETTGKKFYGEGKFGDQPDQNMFGPSRKYIYFCEDGGASPGVYARYSEDGTYFTLFQAIPGGIYDDDETVGIALSPDNKRFYAGIQHYGIIFEFMRDDGLPFE
eukprot:CAMPEP_0183746220 /NCGR_PEP_ID=MMETSP0737-20130205/66643_1 /TAXON_ID=385413 /ORGANISM="Thalassiosira miniscula, Strain CCMP1093" /LENGTH=709 /DNA_ID=CAMNT_0025981907 /DNA_START=159 /DNA_END=2288 /DNA_ORIENTATION=+